MNYLVGLLLLVAAILKAGELLQSSAVLLQSEFTRVLLSIEIAGEVAFGMLALWGAYWQRLRIASMAIFAAFAGYSFYLALQGAASCGCFGSLKVDPRWTLLIDLSVLLGLVTDWWFGRNRLSSSDRSTANALMQNRGRGRWTLVAIGAGSCAIFLLLFWQINPIQDHSKPLLQTAGDLTVLDPASWVGKAFPLVDEVDVDVSQGQWLLLFHRHDCPKCQSALPRYEELAHRSRHERVALIEVPPCANEGHATFSACAIGRLAAERQWFVQTPVEVRLHDGIVVDVSTELLANVSEIDEGGVMADERVQLTVFPADEDSQEAKSQL
jgi:hypothetical protein